MFNYKLFKKLIMNKAELIAKIADDAGITKTQANHAAEDSHGLHGRSIGAVLEVYFFTLCHKEFFIIIFKPQKISPAGYQ